jgi:GNAT superfamily N-acetyltransferase
VVEPHESLIRPASVHDADAVFELAAMMALTFTVEADAFERSFTALVAAPDAHLLVADVAGQVGGYLLGFEHPSFYANGPVAWVEEIAVRDDLRRRDLGSRLMANFEHRVRAGGGRLIALATTRAGAFYEAIGYDHHAAYFRKLL